MYKRQGLGDDEKQELQEWIQAFPENKLLYDELVKRERVKQYVKKRESIDVGRYVTMYKRELEMCIRDSAYFVRYQTRNSWQFSGVSGDLYYPWIHVLADELCQQTGGFSWVAGGACGSIYGYYTWQYRVYENVEGKMCIRDRHVHSFQPLEVCLLY